MSPLELYEKALSEGAFKEDWAQRAALMELEKLYQLIQASGKGFPAKQILRKLLPALPRYRKTRGLYLWGGVGRGKTWLMDLFVQSLAGFDFKVHRQHFHPFMLKIRERLKDLMSHSEPLDVMAVELAAEYRVICLDEFLVLDIADAMVLSGLLQGLFRQGVCLVCTSNTEPEALYQGGLQRERFLPAIVAIKSNMNICELVGDMDHRQRLLDKMRLYISPADESAQQEMLNNFQTLAPGSFYHDLKIRIHGRQLVARYLAEEMICFDFDVLCGQQRHTADYLHLVDRYRVIFLANVPQMDESMDDQARRFISLVDVLYDHGTGLIVSAVAVPGSLYKGKRLKAEFDRTSSRLVEMQSREYLDWDAFQEEQKKIAGN